ncbi:MAG: SWIM zinc finger family protein, partial [Streptosporangiaceae bacterium]
MQQTGWPTVDAAVLEGAVGPTTYRRGVERMRQGGVLRQRWDASRTSLHGSVGGSAGEVYTTIVSFAPPDGSPLRFEQGICTCPVVVDCKHAVALALKAVQEPSVPATSRPGEHSRTWEQSLESLLDSRPGLAGGAAAGVAGSVPLAIELTLSGSSAHSRARGTAAGGPITSLSARLVRPGRNGGWVGGSLGWTKLDAPHLHVDHPAAQVGVLQELYAAYRSRRGGTHSWYSYADDRSIDLAAFESRQLWPLLDEARAVGLQLVYGHKLGPVAPYREAELCLDATCGPAGDLTLAPVVRFAGDAGTALEARAAVDDDPGLGAIAGPALFIGTQAHGVVYLPPEATRPGADPGGWRFGLARLTRTVSPQLQRMALAGGRLEIPAAQQARFRDDFYPRLRRMATVISSDASFTPPEISGPTLVLHADYLPGHDVEVAWEWAYQVGAGTLHSPVAPGHTEAEAGYRDADAELALLRGLDLPLDRFGLRRDPLAVGFAEDPGLIVPAGGRLRGVETMRFSTELLPLLTGQPGVRIEVSGEPADYREASDSLKIELSTHEVPGDADWF